MMSYVHTLDLHHFITSLLLSVTLIDERKQEQKCNH